MECEVFENLEIEAGRVGKVDVVECDLTLHGRRLLASALVLDDRLAVDHVKHARTRYAAVLEGTPRGAGLPYRKAADEGGEKGGENGAAVVSPRPHSFRGVPERQPVCAEHCELEEAEDGACDQSLPDSHALRNIQVSGVLRLCGLFSVKGEDGANGRKCLLRDAVGIRVGGLRLFGARVHDLEHEGDGDPHEGENREHDEGEVPALDKRDRQASKTHGHAEDERPDFLAHRGLQQHAVLVDGRKERASSGVCVEESNVLGEHRLQKFHANAASLTGTYPHPHPHLQV
mmetsp:Transcript_5846/g.10527  ORF Transcript_5846/g.10527 Transcript_5846/m.10527 type:complete len:288 (-) Transcript_5846:85-948(-)